MKTGRGGQSLPLGPGARPWAAPGEQNYSFCSLLLPHADRRSTSAGVRTPVRRSIGILRWAFAQYADPNQACQNLRKREGLRPRAISSTRSRSLARGNPFVATSRIDCTLEESLISDQPM